MAGVIRLGKAIPVPLRMNVVRPQSELRYARPFPEWRDLTGAKPIIVDYLSSGEVVGLHGYREVAVLNPGCEYVMPFYQIPGDRFISVSFNLVPWTGQADSPQIIRSICDLETIEKYAARNPFQVVWSNLSSSLPGSYYLGPSRDSLVTQGEKRMRASHLLLETNLRISMSGIGRSALDYLKWYYKSPFSNRSRTLIASAWHSLVDSFRWYYGRTE